MKHALTALALVLAGPATSPGAIAQAPATGVIPAVYAYADLADLALAASVVVHVKVRNAEKISPKIMPGIAAGKVRFLVTADVVALLRGRDGLPRRISYLVDLPTDSRRRTAKLAKAEKLLFARPAGSDRVQLVAPDAQIDVSPAVAQTVRAILAEAARADAPPRVTGVASGFHSAGSIPGEGETQIFLDAEGDRPVSLTVTRITGVPPRWQVSLGEVVDEASAAPPRDTLGWYRLACFLPRRLPDAAVADIAESDAAAVRADYGFVIDSLGACPRNRPRR